MPTITHITIVKYFKHISDISIHIKHFFRMDLKEITGAFRSSAKFPCLVLESYEGDLSDSSNMETVNERRVAFTIYDRPKKGNFHDQNVKLSSAEEIGLKVIARLKFDSNKQNHFLYNRFLIKNVTYHKVGPVFNEKLYGYRFEILLKAREPMNLNPSDWTDNPQMCN